MKISEALLCSVALAAIGTTSHGMVEAAATHAPSQDTITKSQDRKMRTDSTDRAARPPRRKAPQRQPRYCPACGMG